MIEKLNYHTFFPYPRFRTQQQGIIQKIEKGAKNWENILLVAPNGTGKTVIALSALLPIALKEDKKLVYLCRTHSQSDRVIKELKKINNTTDRLVLGISLRGRNEMCLNPRLTRSRMPSSEAMALCKELRKNRRCSHYRNVVEEKDELWESFPELFTDPSSAEYLIDYSKNNGLCPYFLAKYMLREVKVIVCNFQWLINPDIIFGFLRLLDCKLEDIILVIDECHNIIDVATEVNSKKLNPSFLTKTIEYMRESKFQDKFIRLPRLLRNYLEKKKRDNGAGEIPINPRELALKLAKALRVNGLKGFRDYIKELKKTNNLKREMRNENEKLDTLRDFVKPLVRFWEKWFNKLDSDAYFCCVNIKKANRRKYVSLEINSLDPREILIPIFKKTHSSLCLTGTVNPKVFSNLTGLNFKPGGKEYTEIAADSPFPSKNILALITQGVNTSNSDRNPSMFKKYIGKIEIVVRSTPANTGIFCASYSILNSLLMNGLADRIRKAGKQLFVEDSRLSASENATMVEDFKSLSKRKGGVLLGVCGGRNSEGEDYPGDYMNSVVIVGIPYHMPTPSTNAKIKYYDKVFNKKGWLFGYLSPAMQRANQASGRPIRKTKDKGAIIFMDERFIKQKSWISNWVQKELKIISEDNNYLQRILNKFCL
ncbi:MAG: ATP-dependent DNA helicase [Promethearchaeota archaeon]|nr:MAG: ATP-dependent DNA helicase [Candidatus Lokiarchaeota archaeon]